MASSSQPCSSDKASSRKSFTNQQPLFDSEQYDPSAFSDIEEYKAKVSNGTGKKKPRPVLTKEQLDKAWPVRNRKDMPKE
jgi:hypothetical protein